MCRLAGKATQVVTYCAGPTCPNSKMAVRRLEKLGYRHVRAYEGGKEERSHLCRSPTPSEATEMGVNDAQNPV